jgi:pyrroloquinoline quinone biosynthesis protein B
LRVAFFPSLPEITEGLLTIFDSCDLILVDGTFWSDSELTDTQAGTPSARSIGHIPMSGEEGTIARLAKLKTLKKIFVHINNTNPVLDPRSAEYKHVVDAGWQLGHDGWQLN